MRYSKAEQDTIQKIHVLSGESQETVRKVVNAMCMTMVLACMEREPFEVPLLGKTTLKYTGDRVTKEGRVAEITVTVEPSAELEHIVGQIEDGQECDLEKELKNEISKLVSNLSK